MCRDILLTLGIMPLCEWNVIKKETLHYVTDCVIIELGGVMLILTVG